MAHLSGERGQIILVAAFALGVIFIALAVVINAAIFTENLATRNAATGGDDALEYRYEVRQAAGEAMEAANEGSTPASDFNASVAEIANQSGYWEALDGRVISVEVKSEPTDGKRLLNRTASRFDDEGDDWIVAESVDQSRAIELNITDETVLSGSKDTGFKLSLNDTSGDYWNMTVYRSGGDVVVSVTENGGNTAECSTTTDNPRIDVTGGTLGGKACTALRNDEGTEMWYGTDVDDPYDIVFYNGTDIKGRYDGVTRGGIVNANDKKAIYSATLRYTYETGAIRYKTDVRVAPGEAP